MVNQSSPSHNTAHVILGSLGLALTDQQRKHTHTKPPNQSPASESHWVSLGLIGSRSINIFYIPFQIYAFFFPVPVFAQIGWMKGRLLLRKNSIVCLFFIYVAFHCQSWHQNNNWLQFFQVFDFLAYVLAYVCLLFYLMNIPDCTITGTL